MRSLIIIEVEHGEDTDGVTEFVEAIVQPQYGDEDHQWLEAFGFDFKVIDYTLRIDIPEFFRLDSDHVWGACQSHTDIHQLRDDCIGWHHH